MRRKQGLKRQEYQQRNPLCGEAEEDPSASSDERRPGELVGRIAEWRER